MAILETRLSISECLEILGEQVQSKGRFLRRTSPVIGAITGHEVVLKATADKYSKQMRAKLIPFDQGTRIEYEWRFPFLSKLFGSHEFDESEILDFLKTWMEFRILEESCPDYLQNTTEHGEGGKALPATS
jgi:hypothetical protein